MNPFPTSRREHALHGYVRLFLLLFFVALLPTLLVPLFGTVPVYNSLQPSPWIPPVLALGGILVIWMLPVPSTVLMVSLLLAGSTANILHSQIAPVPDYIALPWDQAHYLNVADLLLLGALLAVPFVLYQIIRAYWD